MRRRVCDRRGQTMVEMAFALPVFMLLVLGVFTIGSIYNHQMGIQQAAREGARLGSVGHSDTSITEEIERLTPNLNHDPSRFAVIIDRNEQRVAVQVSYIEKIGVPVLSILFNNKHLVARAEQNFETDWVES